VKDRIFRISAVITFILLLIFMFVCIKVQVNHNKALSEAWGKQK